MVRIHPSLPSESGRGIAPRSCSLGKDVPELVYGCRTWTRRLTILLLFVPPHQSCLLEHRSSEGGPDWTTRHGRPNPRHRFDSCPAHPSACDERALGGQVVQWQGTGLSKPIFLLRSGRVLLPVQPRLAWHVVWWFNQPRATFLPVTAVQARGQVDPHHARPPPPLPVPVHAGDGGRREPPGASRGRRAPVSAARPRVDATRALASSPSR